MFKCEIVLKEVSKGANWKSILWFNNNNNNNKTKKKKKKKEKLLFTVLIMWFSVGHCI